MTSLPIDEMLPNVVDTLRRERSLVLVAPPGSGKTTRVPPAILRAGLLSPRHPSLILLQPRRVAARAAASRIAEEQGWTLGREVGYQIRFERTVGPETRLRIETEGILNRQLLADPFLEGIGAVVLDEFHERSLHTDLAVALLREVRESVRDDLLLVVMSATLDAEPIARFLGNAPILRAGGRVHPVAIHYRPALKPAAPETVRAAVEECLLDSEDTGHVLVFLPGTDEIRRAVSALEPTAARYPMDVLPLHGSLPPEAQDRAIRPSPRRKVILATNVAETSLTIDGVRTVIDSGLARFATHDPSRGLDRLELGRISRASADQRAGRAGRTAPGRCIRLWSEREDRGMAATDPPEIARVDLASSILMLRTWGISDPSNFGWFEVPPVDRLTSAEELLGLLGALDANRALTLLGRALSEIPAHPRIGRLLLAAASDGLIFEGATLAALLSERDINTSRFPGDSTQVHGRSGRHAQRGDSDLLIRMELLQEADSRGFRGPDVAGGVDARAARRVARARDELVRIARRLSSPQAETSPDDQDARMRRWLLLAYPDRVTRRRGSEVTGVMVGGRGVRLDLESTVRDAEFFLALDATNDRRRDKQEARVRIASAIELRWILEEFPDAVRESRSVRFDAERERVIGITTLEYRGLVLKEDRNAKVDPWEASRVLGDWLRRCAGNFIVENEAAVGWLARLAFLRDAMPEAGWPTMDDDTLGEVVELACATCQTLAEIREANLIPFLRARLSPDHSRRMEELAPESLVVPSGSRIRLRYESGTAPILAVRLQELFGWTETPRLAGGRVPVLLHLLGPNFRPVQVTDDLKSFWSSTYFQVRKDLRARYPRHSWPEDPFSARPEAKGGRRS